MADNNKKLSLDDLAAQYGYAANFFFSDAELHRLIDAAVKEQWSVAKFQGKFMASVWYQNHAASMRQYIEQQARDPASAKRNYDQARLKISNLSTQEGINLDAGRLDRMAKDSLIWGWNDEELKAALASEFKYQGSKDTFGSAATLEGQIRQKANDYGMTISDDTVGSWVQHMLAGNLTNDNIDAQLRNWAISKYPGLTAQLQQGMTVRQVADPYIQSYAQILETPAGAVQLTDPKIQKALQGVGQPTPTPKSGSTGSTGGSNGPSGSGPQPPTQPQSLYDFESTLRQDPRWLTTKNAQQSTMNAAMGVLKDWGLYK